MDEKHTNFISARNEGEKNLLKEDSNRNHDNKNDKENFKRPEDKFISLGIYSIELENKKKSLYCDIDHKKIEVNLDAAHEPINFQKKDNGSLNRKFSEDEFEKTNTTLNNNVIDEYFLYNVTEYIEDKLIIIEDNRQKEKLFAKLSHEFKTPLNSIIGLIDKILDNNLNEEFSEKLKIIQSLSNYVVFLISDVIQYTNLQKIEDLKLHMIEIKIDDSLVSCNKNKSNNIITKLKMDEDIKTYKVIADEFRIKQVLLNLISNSVKFTNKGMINIKCKKIIHNDNDFLKMKVKDTGIGIKEEDKKRLFLDYEMLNIEENLKNNAAGTGLGLSICRSLVAKMKWRCNLNQNI